MPENPTAHVIAKIVVSIGPDGRNGCNFTFVYPSDTPEGPEVIIVGETEEEKEKRQKRPSVNPLHLQVDIGRSGDGVLNWTCMNPPHVARLPSPGAEVLDFVLAHTKAQSGNEGIIDHVLKEIEKLHQQVDQAKSIESESKVPVTKKRPREQVEEAEREDSEQESRGRE
jgi:hypothetical protein